MRVLRLEDQPVNEPDVQGYQSQGDEPGGHPLALIAMNAPILNPVLLVRTGAGHRSSQPGVPVITKTGISQPVIQRCVSAADDHTSSETGWCPPLPFKAGRHHCARRI